MKLTPKFSVPGQSSLLKNTYYNFTSIMSVIKQGYVFWIVIPIPI